MSSVHSTTTIFSRNPIHAHIHSHTHEMHALRGKIIIFKNYSTTLFVFVFVFVFDVDGNQTNKKIEKNERNKSLARNSFSFLFDGRNVKCVCCCMVAEERFVFCCCHCIQTPIRISYTFGTSFISLHKYT